MPDRNTDGGRTLTDVAALARNRRRACVGNFPTFLHDRAADEIGERLRDIQLETGAVAVVTGWPSLWKTYFPEADLTPDDDFLRFDRNNYDLIIHAMSLHWANDPVGQLIQCRRALRPDGLFLACLAGGETLSELRNALAHAEIELKGGASPRVAPMSDIRDLGGILQRAGFSMPVADRVRIHASYGSIVHLMLDLRAMGEANALAARSDRFAPRRLFEEAELHYRAIQSLPDGRISAAFELMFLTGWAPTASRSQRLRQEALSKASAGPTSILEADADNEGGQ